MDTDSYNRIPYSSAQQRRHSFVLRSSRLPMKSPYVGSFRHAPPAASARRSCSTIRKATSLPVFKAKKYTFNNAQLRIPSTLPRQMKNSPHVGWFRHAPPSRLSSTATTTTTTTSMTSQQKNNNWEQNLSTILETITSRLNQETDKIKQKTAAAARTVGDIENRKIIIVVDGHLPGGNPANNCDDAGDNDGRYGGYGERSLVSALPLFSAFGSVIGETFHQSLHDMSLFLQETSIVSTSATISVLCRLAYWFLFPLAHDATSDCSASSSSKSKSITSGTINVMDLFPYMFPVTYKRLFKNKKCGTAGSSNNKEGNSNDDDDDELDSLSSLPSSSGLSEISDDLGLSLSSLAEAYYAHQAAQEVGNVEAAAADEEPSDQQQQQQQAPYSSPLTDQPLHHDEAGGHHLDYMISQMDVARMAKNASRHLDVESILSLPTITYRSESPPLTTPFSAAANHKQHQARQGQEQQQQQQYERTEEEGWSWMIVPPSSQGTTSPDDIIDDNSYNGGAESQQQRQQQQQEQQGDTSCTVATPPPPPPNNDQDNKDLCCVICLDKFVDGDRLRVLPCNHMFHMGCIDRWLSGTDDSHYECITSGCPTCKKHPSVEAQQAQSGGVISDDSQQQQGTNSSEDQTAQQEAGGITILEPAELEDGSVPSWAYTRIGETLALSQSGLTSDF